MAPLSAVTLGLHLGQLAGRSLELALGAYPVDSSDIRTPPEFWDAEDLATEIGDHPCVWTDGGSLETYSTVGFAVGGAGMYLPLLSWRCCVLLGEEG